jgi:2-phosphosulfolactate phosphatase
MIAQVVLIPRDLTLADVRGRTVIVFDVLRATTTMAAALAAGVAQIGVFDSVQAARTAAEDAGGARILCGEVDCLPPPGFDLGNSPREWNPAIHGGRAVFMATTNGTRAIAAAAPLGPALLLAGAIVNAAAVAQAAVAAGNDVTLLCAGTNEQVSLEDILGAGAVLTRKSRCVFLRPAAMICRD